MNVRTHAKRRTRHRHEARLDLGDGWFLLGYAERERLYLEHVLRPLAERINARIAEQLRGDVMFRGESYVKVGYDTSREAATYERIDPLDVG